MIADFALMSNNMGEYYNRNYVRIQDFAANIGGILKIFLVIGQMVNYFQCRFYNSVLLFNDILREKVYFKMNEQIQRSQKNFKVKSLHIIHTV